MHLKTFQRFEIFTWILLVLSVGCITGAVTVLTRKGPVRGKIQHVGHHAVYAFKNIPYAAQPVGNLRFELSKEPEEWISADDLPKAHIACPQALFDGGERLPNSILVQEDCLFLDVYVRKEHTMENCSRPVLVYFHGGGFISGSKEEYGPDYLLRFNDIVLVIPNYRLGILGFLNDGDHVLPSNLGLWDQSAVLKWVSKNIDSFGGDPQSVTIAGHEAGGVSVGLHVLAHTSHDYFYKAISISGTALSPHLFQSVPMPNIVDKVAEFLNCTEAFEHEFPLCLKKTSLQKLMDAQANLKNQEAFLPSVDSASAHPFMPLHPKILYQKGYQKDVPYLLGYAEDEASYEVAREFPKVLKYQHLDKMINHFLKPYMRGVPNYDTVVKAAKYHYLRGIAIPTFESIEPQIVNMLTDFLYKSPAEQIMKLHKQKEHPVFLYVLKYGEGSICGLNGRPCFGDEMLLFNNAFGAKILKSNKARKISQTLTRLWGYFILSGISKEQDNWRLFGANMDANYVEISDFIRPKSEHDSDDTEFWSNLVSDLMTAKNCTDPPSHLFTHSEYPAVGTWGAAGLAILCGVLCVALIGLVVITKKRALMMSFLPVSSNKDMHFNHG